MSIHQFAEAFGDRGHSQPRGSGSGSDIDRFTHHLARVGTGHGPFIATPHAHDLPSLNAALGERYGYNPLGLVSARDFAASGAPSSYMRSGSNAPSRTHSPLNPGLATLGVGYMVPASHGLGPGYYALGGHGHAHHGLGHAHGGLGHGHAGLGHSLGHSRGPTPPGMHDATGVGVGMSVVAGASVMNGVLGSMVPTVTELRQHYMDLTDHRNRCQEMVEKTDRMLAAVKRGIDEMLSTSAAAPASVQMGQGAVHPTAQSTSMPGSTQTPSQAQQSQALMSLSSQHPSHPQLQSQPTSHSRAHSPTLSLSQLPTEHPSPSVASISRPGDHDRE